MTRLQDLYARRPFAVIIAIFAVIAAARIVGLLFNTLNLGPDETQYWYWSQTPAFGYFSKPPMIAWVIGVTTSVFGDAEWAVRIASPLLHSGTGLFLFALARRLYDERVAFWTALAYITIPAVAFSASLITTDVPLLLFWSASLYAFYRTVETGGWGWTAATGLGVGLGLMSKYAMIYFPLGMGIFLFLDAEARRQVGAARLALIAALVGVCLAPNLLWNLQNDFSTVSHTAANANWGAALFNPDKLWKFFTDQFGVFGPLLFPALLAGLVMFRKQLAAAGYKARSDLYLVGFIVPPLLIVSVQAFISRAHANWAAAAYPAATILVTAWLFRARTGWLLRASVALHAVVAVLVGVLMTQPPLVDELGLSNAVKRTRGWVAHGNDIVKAAQGYDAVMLDDREVMGGLVYYAKDAPAPIVIWTPRAPGNHYELTAPFDPETHKRVLYATRYEDPSFVLNGFETVTPRGASDIKLDYKRRRTLYLYELSGFKGYPTPED